MGTILAVSSSPRRNGNSELLLQSFGRGLRAEGWDIEDVRIPDLTVHPCRACDHCATTGECVVKDDMQHIYPLVASADALVLATPIYFGTLSAQLKMFIDRFQCWWHAKYTLNSPKVKTSEGRPGFFICAGALKRKEFCDNALAPVRYFFHSINYHYSDCFCQQGVDEKGAVNDHPDVLQEAFEVGRIFAGIASGNAEKRR